MIRTKLTAQYQAGEQTCPICAAPLPAYQTWAGAGYRYCGKPECTAIVKAMKRGRYIGPNQEKCGRAACNNLLPEGRYMLRASKFLCSLECMMLCLTKGNQRLKCACGCGKDVIRRALWSSESGRAFFSLEHKKTYEFNQLLTEKCGVFHDLAVEYLSGFAAKHYRNMHSVRGSILSFFHYLNLRGITVLEGVTPKTITEFLAWADNTGYRCAEHRLSNITTFFKWARAQGLRQAESPVIGLIHHKRKGARLPRPLEATEVCLAWQLLTERGNARLRLAAAIAEESGLRIGEICRLRLSDVDVSQQKIFVRLPNKTNCERFAFFGEKTKRYFIEWIAERNPNCGHEYLLHNSLRRPLTPGTLARELNQTLCKTFDGEKIHNTGFDTWSTHRMRHTMASRLVRGGADTHTVMAAGGWKSAEAMAGYARVDHEVARRGYDEAMRRSFEQEKSAPRRRTLTPGELLVRRQAAAAERQQFQQS